MTEDDLRRWAAEIPDSAPAGDPTPTLFGAMQRYHDEVLPRDRPKDGVIKNADGTDMWTGDVVTGGAMGYFVRGIMTDYFINRSKGQPFNSAWPNAYNTAFGGYKKATGQDPQ